MPTYHLYLGVCCCRVGAGLCLCQRGQPECYLATWIVLKKGAYQTIHEVGSLARVQSEAQAMVTAIKRITTPPVDLIP
jgi:hypothetical protein